MSLIPTIIKINKLVSLVPLSNFSENTLKEVAIEIIKVDGIINPPVVIQTGSENYEIVSGDFEYHAAVKAMEMDSNIDEIAVFLMSKENSVAIERQIEFLRKRDPLVSDITVKPLDDDISSYIEKKITVIESDELKPIDIKPMILNKLENLEKIQRDILKLIQLPFLNINTDNEESLENKLKTVTGIANSTAKLVSSQIIDKRPFKSQDELMLEIDKFHTAKNKESQAFKNIKLKFSLNF